MDAVTLLIAAGSVTPNSGMVAETEMDADVDVVADVTPNVANNAEIAEIDRLEPLEMKAE